MNTLRALIQLGYKNLTDFEISPDQPDFIMTWKHRDSQPTETKLKAAWKEWQEANPAPDPTTKAKESYPAYIDGIAESARLRHITPGSAQAQVYLEKAEEASDFVAAGYPEDLSTYPFIKAEVQATEDDAKTVADRIIDARTNWVRISTKIENIRLATKRKISRARSTKRITSVFDKAVERLKKI